MPNIVDDSDDHGGWGMFKWTRRLLGATPPQAPPVGHAPPPMMDDEHGFDREKLSFEQNFLQFRHLNDQMNKLPLLAVTLTGGFWYIAAIQKFPSVEPHLEAVARFSLMIFAAIADFMLVLIAIRIRDVMSGYQAKVFEFMGQHAPTMRPASRVPMGDYSMISMYAALFLAGATVSVIGAFALFWPKTNIPFCYAVGSVLGVAILILITAHQMPRWVGRHE